MLKTINKLFWQKAIVLVFVLLLITFGIIDFVYDPYVLKTYDFYLASVLFCCVYFYEINLLKKEISKQVRYQVELKEYYEFLSQAPISILVTDRHGVIKYVNPWASKATGYSVKELVGQHTRIFKSGFTDVSVYEDLWQTILAGSVWRGTLQNKRKNGALRWEQLTISPITTVAGDVEFLAIKEDVDYKKSIQNRLEHQATHDHLTGLYNWQYFENVLTNLSLTIESTLDLSSAFLIYMDLDEFKVVTDSAGRASGDELLRQISMLIRNQMRNVDLFGRLSGDEFVILLENVTQKDSLLLCNRILKAVEAWRFSWEGRIFKVTVSMGLVKVEKGVDPHHLLKCADQTCSIAKEQGGNKVVVYNDNDIQYIEKTLNIISRIRDALDKNLFILFVQPIKSFGGGKRIFEVLIRMVESETLLVPPGAFMSAAERYQLIQEIDKWVVKNIFEFIRSTQNTHDCIFSVNLSGKSINNEMAGFILLESYDINKSNIIFEITETVSVQNFSVANKFIDLLTDAGFKFALDDFGSGMSSFGYLKRMSVDYVKIDGSFVRGMLSDPTDFQIVKALCTVLQSMNKKIIAEFVEDELICECCQSVGVQYVQGYYLGKPIPISCAFCEKTFCNAICELYPKSEGF